MRQVLKLSGYRRLLVAYTLNELAYSIGSLVLAVLVYRQTGSAFGAASFFLSAQFVPALISPWIVARIDQHSPRTILPLLYALEAVAFASLAAVASNFELVPLLVLAVIDGLLALTARAIARAATVAVTAPVGLLREGNALSNASFSICFMAGPALAAVIAASGGTVAALLTNSGLFVVIALTLLTASGLPKAASERSATAGRLRAALEHAARRPAIRMLLSLQAVALLFFTLSIPVEVVFALHVLHAGQGGYGALLSTWGGGTVAGSAVYARWRALPPRVLIALGAAALGAGFLVMAAAPDLAVALVGAAIAGVGNGVEAVAARTTLQEHVEESWMAMMMSLNESMYQAVPGAGIVLGGALAALATPRVALAVAGAGSFAITVVAWTVLTPRRVLAPVASDPDDNGIPPSPPSAPPSPAARS